MKQNDVSYRLQPEWGIIQKEDSLIISGGADSKFIIELEGEDKSFFSNIKAGSTFKKSQLSEKDVILLEQLITAEIVSLEITNQIPIKVAVLNKVDKLNLKNTDKIKFVKPNTKFDVGLIYKFDTTYAELLHDLSYRDITQPHLFVDLAFHHTLSIGPLVFPGETACIACLEGRIAERWGDESPPVKPKVQKQYKGLISEVIYSELNRIADADTSLTNKTVSWNLQDRVIKNNMLLKVPVCPICTKNTIANNGALALPWRKS